MMTSTTAFVPQGGNWQSGLVQTKQNVTFEKGVAALTDDRENALLLVRNIPPKSDNSSRRRENYLMKQVFIALHQQIERDQPDVLRTGGWKGMQNLYTDSESTDLLDWLFVELKQGRQIITQMAMANRGPQATSLATIPPSQLDQFWEYIQKWMDVRFRCAHERMLHSFSASESAVAGGQTPNQIITAFNASAPPSPPALQIDAWSQRVRFISGEIHGGDLVGDTIFLEHLAMLEARHGPERAAYFETCFVLMYRLDRTTARFLVNGVQKATNPEFKRQVDIINKFIVVSDLISGRFSRNNLGQGALVQFYQQFKAAFDSYTGELKTLCMRSGEDPGFATDFLRVNTKRTIVVDVLKTAQTRHNIPNFWEEQRTTYQLWPFSPVEYTLQ